MSLPMKKTILALLIAMCCGLSARAQDFENPLVFGENRLTLITPTLFRLEFAHDGKFIDAPTYMDYINEANMNSSGTTKYSPEEIAIARDGSDPIHYPNTNWMEETMRKTSSIHEHNFTVSGGNTTARFALSAQYLNQDGMYKYHECYVTEEIYNTLEVGDWFVYDEEYCFPDEPYEQERK